MAVKESLTATRVLIVVEAIAAHQPIGVAALARLLEIDKSAVQRALVTLAKRGWIQAINPPANQWITTARLLVIAHSSDQESAFLAQVKMVLDTLAIQTGETAIFSALDIDHLVVAQMSESQQALRMVPRIGTLIPAGRSASGRSLLPFLSPDRRLRLLGETPDVAMLESLETFRTQGYAVSSDVDDRSVNIAAPVFEVDGRPVGAVLVTAPAERLLEPDHARTAILVRDAAKLLSRGRPPSRPD